MIPRRARLLALVGMISTIAPAIAAEQRARLHNMQSLAISPDGHSLETGDGRPFFWLGDTAWELIHRTTPDEAAYYLRERARQGFTVVQAVVLSEQDGITTPTPDGLLPFESGDVARPNARYFDRVADTVDAAARQGLYIALVPVWGDKLTAPWGDGPRLFTLDNLQAAKRYGHYLAQRLAGRTNIIWMLGGDRPARLQSDAPGWFQENAAKAGFAQDQDWRPIWRALAEGLSAGGVPRLTIYHPQGGPLSSSVQLGDAQWITVNGMQSGHGGGHDVPVWEWIARDFAMMPAKPTMDLEPNYEDHPVNPWPEWNPANGYFNDYDVRKQIYRSVFAGGAGVTYGNHAVWQFAGVHQPLINHADHDWIEALHRPGGTQAHYLRDLLLSRPFFGRMPRPGLIAGDPGKGGLHMVAFAGADRRFAMIYLPQSDQPVMVDLSQISAARIQPWWFDPRSGAAERLEPLAGHTIHRFVSPSHGPDWVLVLDDVSAGFGPPGLDLTPGARAP